MNSKNASEILSSLKEREEQLIEKVIFLEKTKIELNQIRAAIMALDKTKKFYHDVEYDIKFSIIEKIKHILTNHGRCTAKDIVNHILKNEPSRNGDLNTIKNKVIYALSKLVRNGVVIMATEGTTGFRYKKSIFNI